MWEGMHFAFVSSSTSLMIEFCPLMNSLYFLKRWLCSGFVCWFKKWPGEVELFPSLSFINFRCSEELDVEESIYCIWSIFYYYRIPNPYRKLPSKILDYHSCSFQLAEQLFDPFSILHSFLNYDLKGLVRIGSLGTNPTWWLLIPRTYFLNPLSLRLTRVSRFSGLLWLVISCRYLIYLYIILGGKWV